MSNTNTVVKPEVSALSANEKYWSNEIEKANNFKASLTDAEKVTYANSAAKAGYLTMGDIDAFDNFRDFLKTDTAKSILKKIPTTTKEKGYMFYLIRRYNDGLPSPKGTKVSKSFDL